MDPHGAPDRPDEADVRGRLVVWSAGSLDRPAATPRWRRALTSAGLVGGAALGLSGLLVGVATWSVVTPVDGQPPRPLWVTPPRVEDKVAVAVTESPSASPSTSPTDRPTSLATGSTPSPTSSVDDHGGLRDQPGSGSSGRGSGDSGKG